MTLNEVYMTKVSHDLAGTIGTLGNTIELFEIDETFVQDGIALLKNSSRVLSARLKFFRAFLGLETEITNEIADNYLKTGVSECFVDGVVDNRLSLAFVLLASECLIRGGKIGISPNRYTISGSKIILDEAKVQILTGGEYILKPQYTAVLWIREWLNNQHKNIYIHTFENKIDFEIVD